MIIRRSPLHADALAMIDGSEREQSAMYAAHLRSAFSPQQLVDGDVRFFVAYDGETVTGCGGYAAYDGYAELKRVYVDPGARGKGWADAIITACEDSARTEGLPRMRLETGDVSHAALRVYERMGYARIAPFGSYVDNGSSIFMEKAL